MAMGYDGNRITDVFDDVLPGTQNGAMGMGFMGFPLWISCSSGAYTENVYSRRRDSVCLLTEIGKGNKKKKTLIPCLKKSDVFLSSLFSA